MSQLLDRGRNVKKGADKIGRLWWGMDGAKEGRREKCGKLSNALALAQRDDL